MRKSKKMVELIWKIEVLADVLRTEGFGEEADEAICTARKLAEKAEYQARREAVGRVRNMVQLDLF